MIIAIRPVDISMTFAIALVISIFFFSAQSVFAHGSGGSFEKGIGNYLIDIGYDPEKPETGVPVRLDFELFDKILSADAPFSNVWVLIEKEKQTVFTSSIHRPEFGKTGLLYTFGEPGTYTISARFQNNEDNIVETSFPLDVLSASPLDGKSSESDTSFLWGVFGLLVGAVLGFVIKRKINNR